MKNQRRDAKVLKQKGPQRITTENHVIFRAQQKRSSNSRAFSHWRSFVGPCRYPYKRLRLRRERCRHYRTMIILESYHGTSPARATRSERYGRKSDPSWEPSPSIIMPCRRLRHRSILLKKIHGTAYFHSIFSIKSRPLQDDAKETRHSSHIVSMDNPGRKLGSMGGGGGRGGAMTSEVGLRT